MEDNARQGSGWLFLLYVIVYVLCFAAVTAAFALIFRPYALYIAIAGASLMFAGAGIYVALAWDHPQMTRKIRQDIIALALLFTVLWPLMDTLFDAVKDHYWKELLLRLPLVAWMVGVVYIPFFIARAIARRRRAARSAHQDETD